jgi:outer membrane receptor for ferrienterochelin and colicin
VKSTNIFFILICVGFFRHTYAQKSTTDSTNIPNTSEIYELKLNEVMSLSAKERAESEVSIASRKTLGTREAPGIVTVITREEILKLGARDLIDILNIVPGFHLGTDVTSTVGVGIRGNWAHEGKFLLQLNGISLNETLFGTSVYGNRFPIASIQRIEIIRGPGSAIYGGYAELGVINIITQSGEEINGFLTNLTYSQMNKTLDRANAFMSFGKKQNDLSVSAFGFYGKGNRSDEEFSDFYGDTFELKNNSELNPRMFYAQLKYKNLEMKYVDEFYNTTQRTGFYINLPNSIDLDFHTRAFQANYSFKLLKNIMLLPKFEITQFMSYHNGTEEVLELNNSNPEAYDGIYENTISRRMLGNTTFSYDPSDDINILAGLEIFEDRGDARQEIGASFKNGQRIVYYRNTAAFVQGLFRTTVATFTAGARIDNHSEFGSAFAPRFAITKTWNKLHAKFLISNAFRQPAIQNITLSNTEVRPEKTNVIELEVGYLFNEKFNLKANIFNVRLKDPIVYLVSDEGEQYENFGKVGTRGIEIEGAWKDKWGYVKANYSFYSAFQNTVSVYAIPKNGELLDNNFLESQLQNSNALLGMPQHKIASYASVNITKLLSLNPTLIYNGQRYGYNSVEIMDDEEVPIIKKFDSSFIFNLNLMKKDFLTRGLNLTLGVHNLLNQKILYIQPYNGGHAPLNGASRSFMLRMLYQIHY